jgi:hypothetical protein
MNSTETSTHQVINVMSDAGMNAANIIPFPVKPVPRPRPEQRLVHTLRQLKRRMIEPLLGRIRHLGATCISSRAHAQPVLADLPATHHPGQDRTHPQARPGTATGMRRSA